MKKKTKISLIVLVVLMILSSFSVLFIHYENKKISDSIGNSTYKGHCMTADNDIPTERITIFSKCNYVKAK